MITDATHKLAPALASSGQSQVHVSLVLSWGDTVHAIALRDGEALVVGRSEPAMLVVADRSLSRAHARFSMREGRVHVEDLGSTNGTQHNGETVREAFVDEGDVVRMGIVDVRVSGRASSDRAAQLLVSHATWVARLDEEIARARLFGRSVCVIAARHAPELRCDALGPLRQIDRACAYTPKLSLTMLAETALSEGTAWAEAARARIPGSLALGLAAFPNAGASAEALVSLAIDAAHAARPGAAVQVAEAGRERLNVAGPLVASDAMRRLYDLIGRVARTALPVLVLGETGSGKELAARAVHDKSPRAKGPFKALNCATIPATLIESVLFGHERGAFTGADKQALGVFEQAQGGSVFLDEVGELSPQAQAALLRVLEQKRIVRVGGNKEIEVDVRVIAATHRDLSAMVAAGSFREDLMFRLDALSLRVPPLRERAEEIQPLAELFLVRARELWSATASRLSEDAVDALRSYAWPGNVRQLKNVIERAVAVCATDEIDLEDLPEQVWAEPVVSSALASGAAAAVGHSSLPDRVREFEIAIIREALAKAHGNQAQAARMLGVPRRTLTNKVHAYELL